jgi:hypothetical protein
MSDLDSIQPCPAKVTDPVQINIRADEKAIENTKTGKVNAVVAIMHILVKLNVIHLTLRQKIVLIRQPKSMKIGLN